VCLSALVRPECRNARVDLEQGFHNLLAADETAGINVFSDPSLTAGSS
jgi:hypothetical protein